MKAYSAPGNEEVMKVQTKHVIGMACSYAWTTHDEFSETQVM
jgi:hypothetical protein